ncbi:hypothetical protein CALCODRAFT_497517 [Calocera cornea HHB12733]|uniref:Calcium permease n=1 Tax=Calocera cornea HHB12733 TaxID=1353952 RepID=A0A165F7P5_9BASI|nr:hypothetical protein CALCODRAFT_497517 [Calocera cornea HHB12733]
MADNSNDPPMTPEPHQPAPILIPSGETATQSGWRHAQGVAHRPQTSGQSWEVPQSASTSYFPPYSPRHSYQPRTTSPGRPTGRSTSGAGRGSRSLSTSAPNVRPRRMNRSASVATASSRLSRDEREYTDEDEQDGVLEDDRDLPAGNAGDDNSPDEAEQLEEQIASHLEEDPVTLKERQSLINVEHPFGLPIWKPALYKKSRTVTRNAETAIHNVPSHERHITPGNIFWTVAFGWWLSLICMGVAAVISAVPFGGRRYAWIVWGLGWYIFWPFGKYVEGDLPEDVETEREWSRVRDEENAAQEARERSGSESGGTIKAAQTPTVDESEEEGEVDYESTPEPQSSASEQQDPFVDPTPSAVPSASSSNWTPLPSERTRLLPHTETRDSQSTVMPGLGNGKSTGAKMYDTIPDRAPPVTYPPTAQPGEFLGRLLYWILYPLVIAPVQLIICLLCFGMVLPIPMAKLNWALVKLLMTRPLSIRFCSPPAVMVTTQNGGDEIQATVKRTRLHAGQAAPSGAPRSTVLLCTYRAAGLQYYKYTIGGVNIIFVNLLPFVFFVIFDAFVLLPMKEHHPTPFLNIIASRPLIFILALLSVIPLSYFIGMAVASISAQSSIGMGAVINATFGSIIEIILYGMALNQGKGLLVEGSIVGSLLAGVLLMPGASMCSGALRRKEQKFNAKSAGVTSTMLIMAIIGTLTPTLFYQTYGNFRLSCVGCPAELPGKEPDQPWMCKQCFYEHPDPTTDPFYQETVKSLMYFCASILLFSYLIGLWFSLRTHATQIWQNPQQLMHHLEGGGQPGQPGPPNSGRVFSVYNKLVNQQLSKSPLPTHRTVSRRPSNATTIGSNYGGQQDRPVGQQVPSTVNTPRAGPPNASPIATRRVYSTSNGIPGAGYGPLIDTVNQAVKSSSNYQTHQPLPLPPNLTTDDFTRAVAVATVSALRHQQAVSPARPRTAMGQHEVAAEGGHEAPSWSRTVSAVVLLACTALYAAIAEVLVDVVDVILEGSGIDEKFLGLTLFALVPNTTEFMNAMSFAMNGNIALSMEIGSAYALQVCLLQIPAMVAFSAWYNPRRVGDSADTFTLIFPRWDVIAIILSIFLLTYVYIEAKSNYHRGSTLILSYLVLMAGFYFAPTRPVGSHSGSSVKFPMSRTDSMLSSMVEPSWIQQAEALLLSLWSR